MQLPLHTRSSAEAYVAAEEWRSADLPVCPLHPIGGCRLARHGTYLRVKPRGIRIARWYCPQGHRTFSLLPDFLSARLPGLLAEVEEIVGISSRAPSIEAAAAAAREVDLSLPSAVRWLRRRLEPVQVAIRVMRDSFDATVSVGEPGFLVHLRRDLDVQMLSRLPPPIGWHTRHRSQHHVDCCRQQEMGADVPVQTIYVDHHTSRAPVWSPNRRRGSPLSARSPPGISGRYGEAIVASAQAVQQFTCSGSADSATTAARLASMKRTN